MIWFGWLRWDTCCFGIGFWMFVFFITICLLFYSIIYC